MMFVGHDEGGQRMEMLELKGTYLHRYQMTVILE